MEQNFVAYYRVSTEKQGRSGLGLDAQRQAVAAFLSNKGKLAQEFTEVESGRKSDRPQLQAALFLCRRQKATLVIARLDRLARNVAFIANLMESGVEFVAVDMPHANRLTLHILAAVAEHEREMISKRTKDALAAAKVRGIRLGNPSPAFALERARAVVIEGAQLFTATHAPLIRELRTGGLTLRAIARELDRRNIPTARGGRWQAVQVRNIIARDQKSA